MTCTPAGVYNDFDISGNIISHVHLQNSGVRYLSFVQLLFSNGKNTISRTTFEYLNISTENLRLKICM